MNHIAEEFSKQLDNLSKFWFPALLNADTGIGRTMRFLLVLKPSIAHPLILQYKGIEIRSFREKRSSNRNALCCMVPDWNRSYYKSGAQILNSYGYIRDNHKEYINTVFYGKANSQGLVLELDEENDLLKLVDDNSSDNGKIRELAVWQISNIKNYISSKHNETFWIECESKRCNDNEFFRIAKSEHTLGPSMDVFCDLIKKQLISLDVILGRKSGGDMFAFKLKSSATNRLFPKSEILTFNNDKPMTYNDWNQLLINYYFINKGDNPVFLSISKDELVEYAIENTTVFPNILSKINDIRKGRGDTEYSLEECVWNDFKIKCGVINKETLFKRLTEEIKNTKNDNEEMPHFLPLLVLFIMPLLKYPELNAGDYYKHLKRFLCEEGVINSSFTNKNELTNSFSTADFSRIKDDLKYMWSSMQSWSIKHSFNYELKREFSIRGRNEYVKMFQAESIFSANRLEQFKAVFSNSSLMIGECLDDERILSILKNANNTFGYQSDTWKEMLDNYRQLLIRIFRNEFQKWDGNSVVRIKEGGKEKTYSIGKTNNLYLTLKIGSSGLFFALELYSNNDDSDAKTYSCTKYKHKTEDIRITSSGYGNIPVLNNQEWISSIMNDDEPLIFRDDLCNRNKLIFKPQELTLFSRLSGRFVSNTSFELGKLFYALIDNYKQEKYQEWLVSNNAKLIKKVFDDSYSLYLIDCAKCQMENNPILTVPNKISVKLVNTLRLSSEMNAGVVEICNLFSAYFDISGINYAETKNRIKAVTQSGQKCVYDVLYSEKLGLWELKPITNIFDNKKSFALYWDDKQISNFKFRFVPYSDLKDAKYEEIAYDSLGNPAVNGLYVGLTIPKVTEFKFPDPTRISDDFSKLSGMETLFVKMKTASYKDIKSDSYEDRDYMLYQLSSVAITSKEKINEIRSTLIFNKSITGIEEPTSKHELSNLIGDYYRLGYINTKYENGKTTISVNRPTLIWIPPKFSSKGGFIKQLVCEERYYRFLLTGARTPSFISNVIEYARSNSIKVEIKQEKNPLMPQTVFLLAKNGDIIEKLSEKYNIQFQKCFYADSLLKNIPSVDDVEKEMTRATSRYDFSEDDVFRAIDYSRLASLFEEKGSYIKDLEVETDEIDKEHSVVSYKLGLYQEMVIFWKEKLQYEVDKHWGHFIGMKYAKAKVVKFNEDNYSLSVPLQIKFPDMIARAITLLTGSLPDVNNGVRTYQLIRTITGNQAKPDSILKQLNQK